ncbi:glycoside hydrolase family 43 protein [Sutcliffiella rhizosphaerae]|uniref:Non-reducing end alpha-L-arabinofuranosidase BoGH43B n=1 Tax=Sutcliffiella rhizosphaerae TaxID=2880967 RepID=A0ABM8YLV5_9BACI|nr:glycoside hydrolase family 43 protein [Sutcliffiella rhizosphaerae]CAG9620948.1 Non-reducing end alpha-L-arabinofuranosidase BoGH43B [Sutcliffiella rhizosphaerae]
MKTATYKNPILPGFYPDPSICRVGEDYYLVASTFEYFPGVPIFHSKDLVNWQQIGHVLDRPSQLNLDETPGSKGIYAPTIRYHNGVYYMITTFVVSKTGARKNFFVTATDPAGPWSDPFWLDNAPGIDPSLFFDDDGRVYYTGNRAPASGQQYQKHMEIWLQELDLKTKALVGPSYSLWDGALKNAHAQEAPHLYKVGEYYYLIIAEGGTGFTHAVTIARSKNLTGPYEGCKRNPILSHRHLGRNHEITCIGHADIVETHKGDWWMVCLGTRPYGGDYKNLGRESFLVPFEWEDGWPLVNPGKGIVEMEMPFPNLEEKKVPPLLEKDHFDDASLGQQWNFIRTPRGDFWSLTERESHLRLKLKQESLTEELNPSFIGRRQQHQNFAVTSAMEFAPLSESESAGIVLLQSTDYHFRFVKTRINETEVIQLIERKAGEDRVLAGQIVQSKTLYVKVEAVGQDYSFYYGDSEEEWKELFKDADGRILSTDVAGGFVGAYIGMYATSNGADSTNHADFDWFEYKEI